MANKKQPKSKKSSASIQRSLRKAKDPGKRSMIIWLLILIGITAICFSPMLSNGFTQWDDEDYVTKNRLLQGPDWYGIFTQPVSANYHPLTMISLAFNYSLTGLDASSYLWLNLILHLINTFLVFQFIWKISGNKTWVAFFTALIFGIHPMHVESVAWVSERKDLLYTFFFLLSLIQYWKFLQTEKRTGFWLCFLFFLLSVLSKPSAIILPGVLLLLDYWKGRPVTWKLITEKIPFLVLALAFAFLTMKIQAPAVAGLTVFPLWTRFFFACYVIMFDSFRFFIPYPLSAFHPFPPAGNLGFAILFSPVVIISLLIFLWFKRKNKTLIFGFLFFVVNMLLVLQIITVGASIAPERYTYVPYIGIAFILAMWLNQFKGRSQNLFWVITGIASIVFGFITFRQTSVWKNNLTLWTNAIKYYPDLPIARSNRANYLISKASQMSNPDSANLLYQQALEDCNVALRAKPNDEESLANRQNVYLNRLQDSLAFADAETLIRLYPKNKAGYYTRGVIYSRRNQPDKALEDLNKCLSLNASIDWGFSYRGFILFNSFKRYSEALSDYSKAIELNPQANHYLNRSYCYYYLGDLINAKKDAQTAVAMGATLTDEYRKAIKF